MPVDDAAAFFRQGREAMRAGDYRGACTSFEASRRLDPAPGTLLNLAVCSERLGRLRSAREMLEQFLDGVGPLDERRPRAVALLADVKDRTPKIRIEMPDPVPFGARVLLDGEEVDRGKWQVAQPVDPGQHVVEFRVPRGTDQRHSFRIAERESVVQSFSNSVDAAPQGESNPPVTARSRDLPTAFYVSLGVGIGGLVTAAGAGAYVLHEQGTVNDHCENRKCDPEGLAAGDRGQVFATINTVAVPVGIVGMALAGYWWFTAKPKPAATIDVAFTSSQTLVSAKGAF